MMHEVFRRMAARVAAAVGSPWTFLISLVLILAWAATGPIFGFNNTWQLVINTGTTIITFLMVFLIQNTQNRDAKAIHLKLDELIRATHGARNSRIDLDNLSDEQLLAMESEYKRICTSAKDRKVRHDVRRRSREEDVAEVPATEGDGPRHFQPTPTADQVVAAAHVAAVRGELAERREQRQAADDER